MLRVTGAFVSFMLAASGQQIGQNTASPAGPVTFETSTQLVIETVSVKDKSGKPVEGLTAKDFIVTEEGAPQTIRFFEYQKLQSPARETTPPAAPSERAAPLARYPHSQIATERAGDLKYRDRRLVALYFDMSAMPMPDQLRAFTAAQKFVRTQLTPADLVAVLMYQSGAVQVLQDFTSDRDRLESIIETLIVGEDQNSGDTSNDASSADRGAASVRTIPSSTSSIPIANCPRCKPPPGC